MTVHIYESDEDSYPPLRWWEIPSLIVVGILTTTACVALGAGFLYVVCILGSYLFGLTPSTQFKPYLGASLIAWVIAGGILVTVRGDRR